MKPRHCDVIKSCDVIPSPEHPTLVHRLSRSTSDTLDASRSTLFASQIHLGVYPSLCGGIDELEDEYTQVSIDVDLLGSPLFSKESIRADRDRSSDHSKEIDRRSTALKEISAVPTGCGDIGESSKRVLGSSTCKKHPTTDPFHKVARLCKNHPAVTKHSHHHCVQMQFCSCPSEERSNSHVTNVHTRGLKSAAARTRNNDVDSTQLGRRKKLLSKKFKHFRMALRGGGEGYTELTTFGQL